MKALIIRFSSIGDIVLTTPVIRCLKQQKDHVEIHYLTKTVFKTLLEANPYIDRLHLLDNDLNPLIEELRLEKFDVIIDLHKNIRTLKVKRALNTLSYSFNKLNLQKWLLVNLKLNLMPDKSIVDRYMETVMPLGVKNDGQGLDYFIPEGLEITNKDLPMSHWAGYVGCVIGGSYNTKRLPAGQWRKFIAAVPFPVMLLGGPEDLEQGRAIAELDPVKVYNSCGKFSLGESALLVRHAKVIVSNDTGLMHIAAAFRKPIISLWGNTSPEMGMYPYFGNHNIMDSGSGTGIIMENRTLYCHPCSKLGYNRCPEGHFRCMNSLDMNELANIVKKCWE
jgi:heptosyltransferase-2